MIGMVSMLGWFGGLWPRLALVGVGVAVLVAWRANDVHSIRQAERGRIAEKDRANVSKADAAARKSLAGSGGVRDPYARRD
jgi:hypothetical protein